MTTTGERIKEARIAAGISQEELGKRIYDPQQQISRYETDKVEPDIDTLCRISTELDVPLFYLMPKIGERLASTHRKNGRDVFNVGNDSAMTQTEYAAYSILKGRFPNMRPRDYVRGMLASQVARDILLESASTLQETLGIDRDEVPDALGTAKLHADGLVGIVDLAIGEVIAENGSMHLYHALAHDSNLGHASMLSNAIVHAFLATRDAFERDGDFEVVGGCTLLGPVPEDGGDRPVFIGEACRMSHRTCRVTPCDDKKVRFIQEIVPSKAFFRFLIKRESWDFADGEFEHELGEIIESNYFSGIPPVVVVCDDPSKGLPGCHEAPVPWVKPPCCNSPCPEPADGEGDGHVQGTDC